MKYQLIRAQRQGQPQSLGHLVDLTHGLNGCIETYRERVDTGVLIRYRALIPKAYKVCPLFLFFPYYILPMPSL